MAVEKQYQEEVSTDNTLTHQHTTDSGGLHHDHVAHEALGGRTADLGKSYFRSMNFIGTVIVSRSDRRVYSHSLTLHRQHA